MISVVIDFSRTRISLQRGEVICLCKETLTISGSLIFWQVGSKNEVVQAVEIGWKAVITLRIVPHLHTIEKLKQFGSCY